MITPALVTEVGRFGEPLRRETELVIVQLIADGAQEHEAEQHFLFIVGSTAYTVELTSFRRSLWLGQRVRVDGAVFEADGDLLHLRNSTVVDVHPAELDDAAPSSAVIRLRAGRHEIEIGLDVVEKALHERSVPATFASPMMPVH